MPFAKQMLAGGKIAQVPCAPTDPHSKWPMRIQDVMPCTVLQSQVTWITNLLNTSHPHPRAGINALLQNVNLCFHNSLVAEVHDDLGSWSDLSSPAYQQIDNKCDCCAQHDRCAIRLTKTDPRAVSVLELACADRRAGSPRKRLTVTS